MAQPQPWRVPRRRRRVDTIPLGNLAPDLALASCLGSFGSIPNAMSAKFRHYQDATEARPDQFIRYDYPKLLDESRAAVADLVNAPVETVVFVSNATEGVNTVFRNLAWADDAKDVILTFSTVYEACANVADFIVDYYNGKVEHRPIPISYPLE